MMQENVKPGDHLKLPKTTRAMVTQTLGQRATRVLSGICQFLLGLVCMAIMYPLFLVFFCPIMGAVIATENANRNNYGIIWRTIMFIGGILGGFAADICFIPMVLLLTICWLCFAVLGCFAILFELVTGRPVRRDGRPIVSLDPAADNMRRAQERLRERAAAGEEPAIVDLESDRQNVEGNPLLDRPDIPANDNIYPTDNQIMEIP